MSSAQSWLSRFGDLNVAPDTGKGRAPHKPLLLLAVLSLVEDGLLTSSRLTLTPELVRRFRDLWPIVQGRRGNRGEIRMPFHALASAKDRVWEVFDSEGRPSNSEDTTAFAILPEEFLALFADRAFRAALRRRLVGSYFPPLEQVELGAQLGFEQEIDESELAGYRAEREAFREAKKRGRSARFKTQIPSSYAYTCALTGYRLTLEGGDGRELIEAAIALGGTYYLPYQAHATPAQFHRAYPRARELFALKRRLDPDYRLRHVLWNSYYSHPNDQTSL